MKLVKILVASMALWVALAAPAQAAVNIAPSQLSGSLVTIRPFMIHTQGATIPATQVVKNVSTTQGRNEISLKGLIPPRTVVLPVAVTNADPNVTNASTSVAPIMPQIVAATSLTNSEQQMVDEINQARAAAGVAPVKVDLRLVTAARIKANDLYLNHYFSHVSPNFGYTGSLLPGLGLNVGYWSENIAGNNSVDGAMAAFMGSIGHRINLLDPRVNYVGVGILEGVTPYNLYVQEFVQE